MANIDNILKDAGKQIAELGEKLFKQFTKQAVADGKAFSTRHGMILKDGSTNLSGTK